MSKLTFDEAIERISDGFSVRACDVQAAALRRTVWVAEWHIPGCLSESQDICTTKAGALDCALSMCRNVRGARADLLAHGRTDRVADDAYVSMAITTIERCTLASLL